MAKKKAPKGSGGTRPKQGRLAGMELERIPEIDDAAHAYVAARNAWQRHHQPMMEAQAILDAKMRAHNLRRYVMPDDEEEVLIVGKEKVVVKKMKEGE